jgi:hypothetical protein
MKTRKNNRDGQKAGISLVFGLRKALVGHVQQHIVFYVPGLSPVVFFFLAHFVTLLTLICIRSGMLQKELLLYKTVVTWAVYGFLPLLLCSYLCFFAVARPAAAALSRKFPHWTALTLNLSIGAAYGGALSFALFLLLEPGNWFNSVLLLAIGFAVGQGNWFIYRKLALGDA